MTDRSRIEGLRREMSAHPCHACPDRAEHETVQRAYDRAFGDIDRLRRSVEQRAGSLVRRFHLLAEVLRRRGYLGVDDAVTAQGRVLAGIYADVDLLVAELVVGGHLDGHQPHELAGIAALLVHEPRRDDLLPPERLPTGGLDAAAVVIGRLAAEIRTVEVEVGVPPLRELDAGFVAPIVRWSEGMSLEESVGELEVSGGDFVRNVKQTLDLLGQLRDVSSGSRRDAFESARRTLQRGIVDA